MWGRHPGSSHAEDHRPQTPIPPGQPSTQVFLRKPLGIMALPFLLHSIALALPFSVCYPLGVYSISVPVLLPFLQAASGNRILFTCGFPLSAHSKD